MQLLHICLSKHDFLSRALAFLELRSTKGRGARERKSMLALANVQEFYIIHHVTFHYQQVSSSRYLVLDIRLRLGANSFPELK